MKTFILQKKQHRLAECSLQGFLIFFVLLGFFMTSKPVFSQETLPMRRLSGLPNVSAVMIEIRKGQETGDERHFIRAEKWLDALSEKGVGNGSVLGLRAWIALFRHEFQKAEELAERARKKQPLVAFHYGILSDAALERGMYEQAMEAVQKMLDLKPDQGALSRAAHLRELHGDSAGAISLWEKAIASGAPTPASTAWCQVELGDVYWNMGRISDAWQQYQAASKTDPRGHRPFARLARVYAVRNQIEFAVRHYEQAIAILPLPEYLEALGNLHRMVGRKQDAEKYDAQVVFSAHLDTLTKKMPDRDLALFYANHDRDLSEALRITEAAIALRKDILTYDVLAWVYYKVGRFQEAQAAITQALRLGTPYSRLHFHAGMIAKALGDDKQAHHHFKKAVALNPVFDLEEAGIAKQHLASFSEKKEGGLS